MKPGIRNWERLSRAEQEALQIRRLRRILRTQIIPFSPFYRARHDRGELDPDALRTFDDLRRIPFTTKQDLLVTEEHPEGARDFILQPSEEAIRTRLPLSSRLAFLARRALLGKRRLRERLQREYGPQTLLFTTGRSTGSIPFFLTLHDIDVMMEVGRRIVEVLGLQAGHDRVINAFPYAPHLAFWQVAWCGQASGVLTLNTGGGRIMGSERMIAAMATLKPTLIVGMPGYFYHVLRMAVAGGADLSSVRLVALGGENVPRGFRRKVVRLMEQVGASGVRVVSVLGFTEARQCWTECAGAERTGFHTYPDFGLFEIIDPESGERLPDGETGELVYTSLEGRGSMVVRYRTGDVVEGGLIREPCPGCGRTVPRIGSSIRRVSNVKELDIGKVKGALVNLNTLAEIFTNDDEIEEWQIEIRKRNDDPFDRDEIVLRCALKTGTDAEAFKERIQRQVHEKAEVHLDEIAVEDLPVLLKRVGMEKLSKEERIVDRRGRARNRQGSLER